MSLLVRPVRPDEYAAVADLVVGVYLAAGYVTEERAYVEELRDTARRAREADVLVAVDGDRLVGTVTSCPPGSAYRETAATGEGEFRMLAVDPAGRGRGVGEQLVGVCLDRSRAVGETAMCLCTLPDMTAAGRLYQRLGFVRTPDRDWSPAPGVDLLAYRLTY